MDTTNEPVAWMYVNDDDECEQIEYGECEFEDPSIQLLYTHPVKEHFEDEPQAEELYEILQSNSHPVKELTDEEIDELSKEIWERPWLEVHRKFAKAILRKAQEK